MPTTGSDDHVTLGELGRRLDRIERLVQDAVSVAVNKDVYAHDQRANEERFKALEVSVTNMGVNRRQAIYASLAIFGTVLAAIVGALLAGAHP